MMETRLLAVVVCSSLSLLVALSQSLRTSYSYNDVLHNEISPSPDDQQMERLDELVVPSDEMDVKGSTVTTKEQNNQCGCGPMTGAAGAPGMPGVPGMHGMRGQDGSRGDKGDVGPKGDSGALGIIGPAGVMGPAGDKGRRGHEGPHGQPGDLGIPGDKGQKGDRGFSGFAGLKGQKGEPTSSEERSSMSARRVAFSVARSQKLGPVLQDTPVTFDVIYANVGDAFDIYSSHFVCRVNGTYLFTAHVLGQNERDVYAWMMMNDRHRAPLHGDARAGYGGGSQTIVLPLKRDDHVWIQLNKDSALLNDYTTFTGHLLFLD